MCIRINSPYQALHTQTVKSRPLEFCQAIYFCASIGVGLCWKTLGVPSGSTKKINDIKHIFVPRWKEVLHILRFSETQKHNRSLKDVSGNDDISPFIENGPQVALYPKFRSRSYMSDENSDWITRSSPGCTPGYTRRTGMLTLSTLIAGIST